MLQDLKDKVARLEDTSGQQEMRVKELADGLVIINELRQGVERAFADCEVASHDARKLSWVAATLRGNSLGLLRQIREVRDSLSTITTIDLQDKQAYEKNFGSAVRALSSIAATINPDEDQTTAEVFGVNSPTYHELMGTLACMERPLRWYEHGYRRSRSRKKMPELVSEL